MGKRLNAKHASSVSMRRISNTVLVGMLRESALLFVWDKLAMQYWDWRVLVNAAIALLMLLRPRFLAARDFAECKHVRAFERPAASFSIREASTFGLVFTGPVLCYECRFASSSRRSSTRPTS